MERTCVTRNSSDFVASLRACAKRKDLCRGTKIHDDILRRGLLDKCSDALVTMYARCGAVANAKELFDVYKTRDIVTWTALIAAYIQQGQAHNALSCFEQMEHERVSLDALTFTVILKACGAVRAVDKGAQIHDEISKRKLLGSNIVLGNALVDMYAKCGALAKACQVLRELPTRNVISWTALIAGCVQHGEDAEALDCYECMLREGLTPDAFTYSSILKACSSMKEIEKGAKVHDEMAKQGILNNNIVVGNALVDMYAKCGSLLKARQVLENLPLRDAISWNALIAGYAENGGNNQALLCFEQMQHEGLSPNGATYIAILTVFRNLRALDRGEKLHRKISKEGFLMKDIELGNALVDMYAKCGAIAQARQVLLEELPIRNVVSWSLLIAGYIEQGDGEQALDCYEQMKGEDLSPDAVTFTYILKACGSIRAADKGARFHVEIAKRGWLVNNVVLGTALVDMYAKCGALGKAQEVLEELPVRNAASWNALIAGHVHEGDCKQALKCYEEMQREGVCPDAVTFVCVLKSCGSIRDADKGEKIHHQIAQQGFLSDHHVLSTSLVDMYAKCGALATAQKLLVELPTQSVTSWTALIAAYAQDGEAEHALECLKCMQFKGLSPDAVTYACILKACGSIGAADKGKKVHTEIAKQGLLRSDIVLGNAMVDMYAKCGAISKAQQVLEELPVHDSASWNALIAGYAQQCQAAQALYCLERMQHEGLPPNAVTFSSMLSACSRSGLFKNARRSFADMCTRFGVRPDLEHYGCIVDLLARVGCLDKAAQMIQAIPFSNGGVWSALLSACQKCGDLNVGTWAFECGLHVETGDVGVDDILPKMYAAAGPQKDAEGIT